MNQKIQASSPCEKILTSEVELTVKGADIAIETTPHCLPFNGTTF